MNEQDTLAAAVAVRQATPTCDGTDSGLAAIAQPRDHASIKTSHLTRRRRRPWHPNEVLDVSGTPPRLRQRPAVPGRVLDGIFSGISQPDIAQLFSKLAASTYISGVQLPGPSRRRGSAGLMLFLQLDLDAALALDPQARSQAGQRLVRLIAGNPVTMEQMTRHVPDGRLLRAGHHPPPADARREIPGSPTTASPARLPGTTSAAASQVARRLDAVALGLLREATGVQAPVAPLPSRGDDLVGFHNSATTPDLGFDGARSYSLMRPPRTGRRWITVLGEVEAGGVGLEYANSAVTCYFS